MTARRKMTPFALAKEGTHLVQREDSGKSYEDGEGHNGYGGGYAQIRRNRKEAQRLRHYQNKQARQALKNDLKDEIKDLGNEKED